MIIDSGIEYMYTCLTFAITKCGEGFPTMWTLSTPYSVLSYTATTEEFSTSSMLLRLSYHHETDETF